ncbi:hypothetical protein SUDANB135_00162 [Streptomyces sp. SudanB135_2055]
MRALIARCTVLLRFAVSSCGPRLNSYGITDGRRDVGPDGPGPEADRPPELWTPHGRWPGHRGRPRAIDINVEGCCQEEGPLVRGGHVRRRHGLARHARARSRADVLNGQEPTPDAADTEVRRALRSAHALDRRTTPTRRPCACPLHRPPSGPPRRTERAPGEQHALQMPAGRPSQPPSRSRAWAEPPSSSPRSRRCSTSSRGSATAAQRRGWADAAALAATVGPVLKSVWFNAWPSLGVLLDMGACRRDPEPTQRVVLSRASQGTVGHSARASRPTPRPSGARHGGSEGRSRRQP